MEKSEFNEVTSFRDCKQYQKKDQENDDVYSYMMGRNVNSPMCYMGPGQNMQGLQYGERRPPTDFIDIESYLREQPIQDNINGNVIDNIHDQKNIPVMPDNKLVYNDCTPIDTRITKLRKMDFPDWSIRMDQTGLQQTNYMLPGIDTRQQVKDVYKNKELAAKGKPMIPLKRIVPLHMTASLPGYGTGNNIMNTGPSNTRTETIRVANTINPNMSLNDLVKISALS